MALGHVTLRVTLVFKYLNVCVFVWLPQVEISTTNRLQAFTSIALYGVLSKFLFKSVVGQLCSIILL